MILEVIQLGGVHNFNFEKPVMSRSVFFTRTNIIQCPLCESYISTKDIRAFSKQQLAKILLFGKLGRFLGTCDGFIDFN